MPFTFKSTVGSGSGNGTPGANGTNGTNGTNGADALWNYVGAYNGGNAYAVGDVVTYNGQLWYRYNSNGGNVGDTPSPGLWNLLAAKGTDGIGGTANTGDIAFDGIKIIGAGTASGDGFNLGTIRLVPDGNIVSDQYVIIDPTSPNHIHLRAGGVQDASTANLFLGGERTGIEVSDSVGHVGIRSKNTDQVIIEQNLNTNSNFGTFITADTTSINIGAKVFDGATLIGTVTSKTASHQAITTGQVAIDVTSAEGPWEIYFPTLSSYTFQINMGENNWVFGSNGVLHGPAMGAVRVNSLLGNSENTLVIANSTKLILDGGFGEFLNDESANNQIATIGNLPTGDTGTFMSHDSKIITVVNGIITSIF